MDRSLFIFPARLNQTSGRSFLELRKGFLLFYGYWASEKVKVGIKLIFKPTLTIERQNLASPEKFFIIYLYIVEISTLS